MARSETRQRLIEIINNGGSDETYASLIDFCLKNSDQKDQLDAVIPRDQLKELTDAVRTTTMRELDFFKLPLSAEMVVAIVDGVIQNPQISHLNFSCCGITNAAAEDIAKLLNKNLPGFTRLNLKGNEFTELGFTTILQALTQTNQYLKYISLHLNDFADGPIAVALKDGARNPNLEIIGTDVTAERKKLATRANKEPLIQGHGRKPLSQRFLATKRSAPTAR